MRLPQLFVCQSFCAFAAVSRLPRFAGVEPPSLDLLHKVGELVFHLYAKCKDTWGGPRNLTSGLCSRFGGSCPYNSWLNSIIFN
jgi:hypothetical protein